MHPDINGGEKTFLDYPNALQGGRALEVDIPLANQKPAGDAEILVSPWDLHEHGAKLSWATDFRNRTVENSREE